MKRITIYLSIAFILLCHNAGAYDFYAVAPSGQRLYYKIVNGNAVVTYKQQYNYSQWDKTYYYNGTKPAGNLVIPDSVTYQNIIYSVTGIDDYAFYECDGLTSVTMGNNIRSIGNYAFCNDSLLNSITFSDSLVTIGNYAFNRCFRFIRVIIPDMVTYIGDYAFYQCRISYLSIGRSVSSLGSHAFQNCPLETMIMKGYPPATNTAGNDYILALECSRLRIYVGCGLLSLYQNSNVWSRYSAFLTDGCITITTSVNDAIRGGVSGGGNYMIGDSVTLTAIPFSGSSFIGWSTGSQVNPLKFVATQSQTITAAFGSGPLPHDTIYIHDTTYLNNYIHDTTIQYVDRYIHDTTFYAVYIHDTTTIHDTTYQTIHDTAIAYINVPVHDTTYLNIHDTLIAYIPIHDTVYIHDTVFINQEGIDEVEGLNVKIYQRNGRLVVDGAGQNTVSLFDAVGRTLAVKREDNERIVFDVPNTGVYLVKIGVLPARRILVIK